MEYCPKGSLFDLVVQKYDEKEKLVNQFKKELSEKSGTSDKDSALEEETALRVHKSKSKKVLKAITKAIVAPIALKNVPKADSSVSARSHSLDVETKDATQKVRRATIGVMPTGAPGANVFQIHLPADHLSSTFFNPSLTVRAVLEKVCSTREEFYLDKYIPQDLEGNPLDLDITLGALKLREIAFRTPNNARVLRIYLPSGIRETTPRIPNDSLRQHLERVLAKHPNIAIHQYMPTDYVFENTILPLDTTITDLNLGSDDIKFFKPMSKENKQKANKQKGNRRHGNKKIINKKKINTRMTTNCLLVLNLEQNRHLPKLKLRELLLALN